jgi:hypothetical protein
MVRIAATSYINLLILIWARFNTPTCRDFVLVGFFRLAIEVCLQSTPDIENAHILRRRERKNAPKTPGPHHLHPSQIRYS